MSDEKLEYGKPVLVSDDLNGSYVDRIFILLTSSGKCMCIDDRHTLEDFEEVEASVIIWKHHRPMPTVEYKKYTLETIPVTGMLRKKTWAKGLSVLMTGRWEGKIEIPYNFKDGVKYKDLLEEWEWLHEDRTTSPCGVKIGGGEDE